jgi:hypothetical protein
MKAQMRRALSSSMASLPKGNIVSPKEKSSKINDL